MLGIAGYAAAMQAYADFANGVRRQYILSPDGKTGYTSRKDGPFEIWTWAYYPLLGHGHVFAQQRYVEMYNLKMKAMYEHPEQFRADAAGGHNATTETAATQP